MADYDDSHFVSVRGLGVEGIESSIRPFVLETIEAFGVERWSRVRQRSQMIY